MPLRRLQRERCTARMALLRECASECRSNSVLAPPTSSQHAFKGKWRISIYGDSLEAESFDYIATRLTANHRAVVNPNHTSPGTSPCSWIPYATMDAKTRTPNGVIIETFGNNMDPCQLHSGVRPTNGSASYFRAYRSDLIRLMAVFPPATRIWLVAAPAAWNDRVSGSSRKAKILAMLHMTAATRSNTWALDAGAAVEKPGVCMRPLYLAFLLSVVRASLAAN